METEWEESEPKRPKRTDAAPSNSNDERPPPARVAQPSPSPPLMLLLVGLPGAGKSTFAETILSHSSQPWVRICQDTINRGRRGSREQCISAAETVLQSKSNVIIDRTNLTPDQRSQFVRLARRAGAGGRVHCVFFDLPTRDCGARASKRELHEGGVNGKGAFAVVGRLSKELQAAGPPQVEKEGLASLIICKNDADSNAAAHVWSSYVAPVQAPGDAFDPVTLWEQQRSRLRALAAGASTAGSEERNEEERGKSLASATMQTKNAFNVMMAAAAAAASQRQRDVSGSGDSSRGAHGVHQTGDPADEASPSRHRFAASPFLEALQDLANHPERHAGVVLRTDTDFVIIRDKYPKARHHFLIIARDARLQGPLDLTTNDIALVKRMKDAGMRLAEQSASGDPFAFGFHSKPSMKRLHLHVISRDYDSASLKTKKHWQSFCTPFFLDVDWVIHHLQDIRDQQASVEDESIDGHLTYDVDAKEAMLKGGIRCHMCGGEVSSLPRLKEHFLKCKAYLDAFAVK